MKISHAFSFGAVAAGLLGIGSCIKHYETPKPLGEIKEYLSKYDDGDNVLTFSESMAVLREEIDTDKNGYISQSEYKEAFKLYKALKAPVRSNLFLSEKNFERALIQIIEAQELERFLNRKN